MCRAGAVLARGPGAALSHASGCALWALQRGEPSIVDVTATRTGRKRPGIRVHRPRSRRHIHGKEVDFLFPQHRLIVEIDSWRYHKSRRAFEDDRARDVFTSAAGYRTLRFTDRQLTRQPGAVARAVAHVLADRRAA